MSAPSRVSLILVLGLLAPLRNAAGQESRCRLDSAAAWARGSRSWSNESGARWSNDSLRRVLLRLVERDQAARAQFGARVMDSLYVQQMMSVDSLLAAEMAVILDRFGLPTRAMVGPAGSDAAMLIIQHSWPLQERALASASALPAGQISAEKLAMLEDRVRVHQGRPQRFGTQFNTGSDGVFRLAAVSDTAGLDARRAAAGIPPMRLYVCLLEEAGMRVDRGSLPPALLTADSVVQLLYQSRILGQGRELIAPSGLVWHIEQTPGVDHQLSADVGLERVDDVGHISGCEVQDSFARRCMWR
jgi:hypothetical protein